MFSFPIGVSLFKKGLVYLFYLFFLPLWFLQKLIVRNNKIWLFGAWYGEKYSDNSKYMYNFVRANKKDIKAIWLTRNEKVRQEITQEGGTVYDVNSLKGIYYSLRAKYVFISSGKEDVNPFFIGGASIIQLFHGSPIKKIALDDKFATSNTFFHNKIVPFFYPFIYEYNCQYVVSNSSVFTPFLASAFDVPLQNIIETGCPRNDSFYVENETELIQSIRSTYKSCKIVLYLPTFRGNGQVQSIFNLEDFNAEKIEDFLEVNNMVLISKAHFVDKVLESNSNPTSRILHLNDTLVPDVNLVMKDVDVLITDYSSVYFDFLHTKKPIIFAAFDLESYLSDSREMYFEYSKIICGPIVTNWESICEELENIENVAFDTKRIEEKSRYFNKYLDGQNCQRLFDQIIAKN